jgi:hypothetical protein
MRNWLNLFENLNEAAGMSRILKHMNRPFATISAFTGSDRRQNIQQTRDLVNSLMTMGLGGIKLDGHYEEGDYISDEISYFVPYQKNDRLPTVEDFFEALKDLGHRFNQYSIILGDGVDINLVMMAGPVERLGDATSMRPEALIPAWSKIKKKRYGFVSRDSGLSYMDHSKLA